MLCLFSLDNDTRLRNMELPTAPKASRATGIDDSKIPTIPPFQAYISNIPYDLEEEDLADVFKNLKVCMFLRMFVNLDH